MDGMYRKCHGWTNHAQAGQRCGSVMLDLATRALLRASLAPPPQARQRGRRILGDIAGERNVVFFHTHCFAKMGRVNRRARDDLFIIGLSSGYSMLFSDYIASGRG